MSAHLLLLVTIKQLNFAGGTFAWSLKDYRQPGASDRHSQVGTKGRGPCDDRSAPNSLPKLKRRKGSPTHALSLQDTATDRGQQRSYRYCLRRASMSALTLLIWERWDFSSSRSNSSRCAFFMASMAVWDRRALAPSTTSPKNRFLWRCFFVCFFFKGTRTELSQ